MLLTSFLNRLSCVLLITAPALFAAEPVWIRWTPNSEPDIGHYVVCRSTESKPQPDLPGDFITVVETPFFIDPDAQPDSTYYYWVAAVDTVGNTSLFSGPLEVIVPSNGSAPAVPGDLPGFDVEHLDEDQDPEDPFVNRSLDNDDRLDFGWATPLPGVAFYRIYLSVNGLSDSLVAVTQEPAYSVPDVVPETNYRLRVDAVNETNQVIARGYSDAIIRLTEMPTIQQPETPRALNVE
jgi:hypothetical protein